MIHTPITSSPRRFDRPTPETFSGDIDIPLPDRPVVLMYESPPCAHAFFHGAGKPTPDEFATWGPPKCATTGADYRELLEELCLLGYSVDDATAQQPAGEMTWRDVGYYLLALILVFAAASIFLSK